MSAEAQKRRAGEAAAALVEDGMTVGLGTGSTAARFVEALGRRVAAEGLRITGVPTSEATAALARSLHVPLADLDEMQRIHLTVDGADEIGPELALIKGGGGALLREKLVWEASDRCVVIADAAKRVERLGVFPLPIEVVRFGQSTILRRVADVLGSFVGSFEGSLRSTGGEPLLTDSGNVIWDLHCGAIKDPGLLGSYLKAVTGVVEHGLFVGLADEALIATDEGVQRVTAAR